MNECLRCGTQIVANSPFCMNCGMAASPSAVGMKPWPRWLPVVTGLVVLGAAAWSLSASGVLTLGGRSPKDSPLELATRRALPVFAVPGEGAAGGPLAVNAQTPDSSLAAPAETAAPSLAAPDSGMPEDIRRWLEHLKRVDLKREALNRELAAEIIGIAGNLKPGAFENQEDLEADAQRRVKEGNAHIARVDGHFSALTNDFQSLPPPAECRRIAAEYNALLLATREMVREILKSMHAGDIGSLVAMMNTSYSRIDSRASNGNKLIDHLCKKYNEPNVYELFVEKSGNLGIGAAAAGLKQYEELLKGLMKDDGGG